MVWCRDDCLVWFGEGMVVWYGLVKGLVVRYGIVIGWLLVWFSEEMVGMVWGGWL